MSGLFATFNVAKRGIFVQQKAIDVTSHNIANANTVGYSRQRALIETTRPFGMPDMNNSVGPGQLGTGAEVSCISRVRDAFLDYQIRAESSTKGCYEGREKFLSEIESIMNEPNDTGISNLINKFYDSWQQLSKAPESSNARTVVAQQSKALSTELNQTYKQLQKLKGNTQDVIKQTVVDINSMLNQINKLNQEIIGVKVGGNEPNDLMDKRDLLVDELSAKFGIQIDKKRLYGEDLKALDVDGFTADNKDKVALVKVNPNDKVMRFSYVSSMVCKTTVNPGDVEPVEKDYEITYYRNGDMSTEKNAVTIKMSLTAEQYKGLDECRVLWANEDGSAVKNIDENGEPILAVENETTPPDIPTVKYEDIRIFKPNNGELKGYMSVQEDIDKNIEQLNKLAKAIALSVNSVHSGKSNIDVDTLPFFVNKDAMGNVVMDKNNKMWEAGIDASNISVNDDILNDVMKIKVATDLDNPAPTDGKRALAIATLRDKLIKIQDIKEITTRADLWNANNIKNDGMTFEDASGGMKTDGYFKDIVNRLGVQTQEAKRIVKNQGTLLSNLVESRDAVSGVSQDEEMANLVQFQHAYSANAKVISTVNELLDVVINGLIR